MSKSGLVVKTDKMAGLVKGIAVLENTRVLVGVPQEDNTRDGSQEIGNAALAYIHDNGAPEANIPPRPFMRPGILSVKAQIDKGLMNAGKLALDGKPEAVLRQYHAIGLTAQMAIRRKITTGPFVPLKPGTIAGRKARGRTGTKPLIDTGQLRNAITYVIKILGGR